MATADQIKMLVKAHFEKNEERFKTATLQIAAYEAKLGHANLARNLRDILDKSVSRNNIVHLNKKNDMLQCSSPNYRLSDLIVSEEISERITRVLDEFMKREKLKKYGFANRRKILIEGAPGTGKTMTAAVIASELKLPMFTVQMDKLMTKFMGETSVKLRQIFDSISENIGVYLFDEFDAIGADRGMDNEVGEMRRVLNSFLLFIEQDMSDSIIIAATNNQKILDQALFRRFDDVLHYDLPTKTDAYRLISNKLCIYAPDFSVTDKVLDTALSLSHAEISRACDDVIKKSILNDEVITEALLITMLGERLAVYHDREA